MGGVYEDAIELWGAKAQLEMIVEECSELIKAIQKLKRHPDIVTMRDNVIEEMADVKLMIEQGYFIFGKHECKKIYHKKKDRLIKRILEAKEQEEKQSG